MEHYKDLMCEWCNLMISPPFVYPAPNPFKAPTTTGPDERFFSLSSNYPEHTFYGRSFRSVRKSMSGQGQGKTKRREQNRKAPRYNIKYARVLSFSPAAFSLWVEYKKMVYNKKKNHFLSGRETARRVGKVANGKWEVVARLQSQSRMALSIKCQQCRNTTECDEVTRLVRYTTEEHNSDGTVFNCRSNVAAPYRTAYLTQMALKLNTCATTFCESKELQW